MDLPCTSTPPHPPPPDTSAAWLPAAARSPGSGRIHGTRLRGRARYHGLRRSGTVQGTMLQQQGYVTRYRPRWCADLGRHREPHGREPRADTLTEDPPDRGWRHTRLDRICSPGLGGCAWLSSSSALRLVWYTARGTGGVPDQTTARRDGSPGRMLGEKFNLVRSSPFSWFKINVQNQQNHRENRKENNNYST